MVPNAALLCFCDAEPFDRGPGGHLEMRCGTLDCRGAPEPRPHCRIIVTSIAKNRKQYRNLTCRWVARMDHAPASLLGVLSGALLCEALLGMVGLPQLQPCEKGHLWCAGNNAFRCVYHSRRHLLRNLLLGMYIPDRACGAGKSDGIFSDSSAGFKSRFDRVQP